MRALLVFPLVATVFVAVPACSSACIGRDAVPASVAAESASASSAPCHGSPATPSHPESDSDSDTGSDSETGCCCPAMRCAEELPEARELVPRPDEPSSHPKVVVDRGRAEPTRSMGVATRGRPRAVDRPTRFRTLRC